MSEQLRLRPTELEWRDIEGEVVALDVRKSVYIAVNRTGALLWPALAEGTTKDALISLLSERFDLDRAAATSDVDAFLANLREQDLLEES